MFKRLNLLKILSRGVPIVVLLLFAHACQMVVGGEKYDESENIRGISFVAADEKVTNEDIMPIKNLGATWVSLMPYGFVWEKEHVVNYNLEWQWWGETDGGLEETVKLARSKELKVMIKPQVWFRHGDYTGDYVPPDSAKVEFKKSFVEFVLHYAEFAQNVNADLYCIGTEWHKFIDSDPGFWQELIIETKKIYTGQLTYAANWDEYKTVPFWQELSYIGVNAYFPLSDKKYPNMDDLHAGWQPWTAELNELAEREQKSILFTEYGYRSTVNNASKPWVSDTKLNVSLENQTIAYAALYNEFWQQPWFAGGFAWKWFHNNEDRGGEKNIGFTPQNKPAEDVIKTFYGKTE